MNQTMKFNTAIFYDIENLLKGYGFGQRIIQGLSLKEIFKQIQGTNAIGKVAIQRAYANWSDVRLGFMKNELLELGIEPIQVFGFSYSGSKNVADIQLAVEVTDLIHTHPSLEIFVIVSGDGGYASLAKKLHEYGKTVIGCAYQKATNKVFAAVCDHFVWINDPEESDEDVLNNKITDKRALRLIDKISKIDITYSEIDIWKKIKEILTLFENSNEYKQDLEVGMNLAALRELISGVIVGFDHTKLGFGKFVEFLNTAFENTNLSIYINPPSDVKVAYKNINLKEYSLLNSFNLKQIPNYADILASDPRLQRMQRKVQSIKSSEHQDVILNKVKEVIHWIENDLEFSADLRISGCSLSVFKEAINVSVIGFSPIKFGYIKFIEFLRFAFNGTKLGVWQNKKLNSDVKVGFKNFGFTDYSLMQDLEPKEIHSVDCYKLVLSIGSPNFKLPEFDSLKKVAITLQNHPVNNLVFGEACEQLMNANQFQLNQENLKLAFSCFISAGCFNREPETARLSEQKLTLYEEFNSYEKMIDKLKTEMQKKIILTLGECKYEIFNQIMQ
ncbi:MAG: NYN domain-containing protein [Candidatus Pacearchaeota archaeon]